MKKIIVLSTFVSLSLCGTAQTTLSNGIATTPVNTHLELRTNTTQRMKVLHTNGFAGFNITNPMFNLQIHGTADFIDNGGGTSMNPMDEPFMGNSQPKSGTNYGKTSRIGLTNTTTSNGYNDGAVLQMSENDFYIKNREAGNLLISIPSLTLNMHQASQRMFINTTVSTSGDLGKLNLQSNENGLFIRTTASTKYGLSIRSHTATDNAIQVMGTTGTDRNFAVKANGEVYARKYTTTLSNIPDYVFEPDYDLMSLADLRKYITENKHLPNIPSASEYQKTNVDLGEMNRLLLEKTEELTLYILQLEERIKSLEKQN